MTALVHGLVTKEQSGFFWVEADDGAVYRCRLRGKLMEQAQSSDIAAIGDHVTIHPLNDATGTITAVDPRTSVLSRSARTEGKRGGGSAEREQVIIANADQAFFVFAAASPDPQPRALDRFLVVGEKSNIERLHIVVNKIDLAESTRSLFAPYEAMGYPVIYTSALMGVGVDALRDLLRGNLSVFTGPSGVGKTSLLNAIQPGLGRSVKAVSQSSKLGMHTTRYSELIRIDGGGYLADTPGLRHLTIWDIEPEELDAYFREIAPYVPECRFGDCTHHDEPGCAVREAAERGAITPARYESYLSLRDELAAAYAV
ncbi:MAG: ribosome small subunit-dependent GTPase A [bacterium]|nr:ribosome small subunit-dependent GTPase A [bacterium]